MFTMSPALVVFFLYVFPQPSLTPHDVVLFRFRFTPGDGERLTGWAFDAFDSKVD
jgi:hypothetical protein